MSMRFRQIDKIVECEPGKFLVAEQHLTGEERYLKDHFPLFPVMPGVLMMEALFQASCWLIRQTEDFSRTVLMLKEIRNAKFADFLQPGQTLTIHVEILKSDESTFTIKASGTKGDVVGVSARLIVACSNAEDDRPEFAAIDENLRILLREDLAEIQ